MIDSAPGYDGIQVNVFKKIRRYISPTLQILINRSLQDGVFPTPFKLATVVPIHKKGDTDNPNNYRPISLISNISKILEKCAKKRLYNYLENTNFFANRQFGFRKGRGIHEAMDTLISQVYQTLDSNNKCIAIFTDLSKAFDTVQHDIFVQKLTKAGIEENVLDWFKSELLMRTQRTKINNVSSDPEYVISGCPQVSSSLPIRRFGLFEDDPEFTAPIGNITTPVGREAILSCIVNHIGKYKVGWLKAEDQTILTLHDKIVTHNSRISVTHDNRSTWQLHIRHVRQSDRGCYMCQINTSVMKKQIGCIDVHASRVRILESEPASVIFSPVYDESYVEIDPQGWRGKWEVSKSQRPELKSQMFYITKPDPCRKCRRLINRARSEPVPPDILYEETSSDMSVHEGQNASLSCRATGHPNPRVTWRREDTDYILIRKSLRDISKVESYNGSTLYLWKVDRRQMGAYLCIASNDVPPAVSKRIILNVNFAPSIRVPNQLLGAPLNTDVQLQCTVEAFPNTVNYWDRNGEIIFDGSKYTVKEKRSNYAVHMWLVVKKFNRTDAGTYTCVSTNSVGKAEATLRLYELVGSSQNNISRSKSSGIVNTNDSYNKVPSLLIFVQPILLIATMRPCFQVRW